MFLYTIWHGNWFSIAKFSLFFFFLIIMSSNTWFAKLWLPAVARQRGTSDNRWVTASWIYSCGLRLRAQKRATPPLPNTPFVYTPHHRVQSASCIHGILWNASKKNLKWGGGRGGRAESGVTPFGEKPQNAWLYKEPCKNAGCRLHWVWGEHAVFRQR